MTRHKLRTEDIALGGIVHSWECTPDMYLPCRNKETLDLQVQPDSVVRRGMCYKSGGNVDVCKACPGVCRLGAELVRRSTI